ncbi:MAG: hypothetical protein AAFN51_10775 [Pseudomonadota bacterium]
MLDVLRNVLRVHHGHTLREGRGCAQGERGRYAKRQKQCDCGDPKGVADVGGEKR